MSYIFFPPRTENYFPPGMPYLAGLRGIGLGDYAADLAAYKTAATKWRLAKIAYDRAVKTYAVRVKAIDDAYASAVSSYNADKAAWDTEYANYLAAAAAWNAAFAKYKQDNTDRSMKIAAGHGLNLTQAYYSAGACLTQAQHDDYARQCTTVKGLGLRGLGASDPDCGMAGLPVCQFGPFPSVRAKPTPPTRAAYPAAPVSPGPEPVAPTPPPATPPKVSSGGGGWVNTKTPTPGVLSPSNTPDPGSATDPAKNAGMIANGLILVALGVGGYLVYRTLKKPKAAA